jgi:biotin carboxylase
VVVKASGLAAGKGVIVPSCADEAEAALRDVLLEHAFGAAGDTVVIEERLEGPEVSLLAFVDVECARIGVEAGPVDLPVRPDVTDDAPMACGTASEPIQIQRP